MNSLNKVVIFGATSAIAEAAIKKLVSEGSSVYCIARNKEKLNMLLEDLKVRAGDNQIIAGCQADFTNQDQYQSLWQQAKETLKECDSVLIAHGILPDQKLCEKDSQQTIESIEINALSIIGLLTPIANDFEKQGNGVIAVISSVAGDRGRQSNYIYGAAKGMLNIYLQGLRNRLYRHGVDVVTIKPGQTITPMTEHLKRKGFLWAKPEKVGHGIIKAMRQGKNIVYLPWRWKMIMFIIKLIPESLFKKLSL